MGTLRWTGKAFQFVGKILTAEEFEEWVEAEGKAMLETQFAKLAFKRIGGRARAKKKLRQDLENELERTPALRAALSRELDELPGIVFDDAKFMRDKKPKIFHSCLDWKTCVVAVPRVLIRNDIRNVVTQALLNSAELSRFTGLPEVFLARKAEAAEDAFFASATATDGTLIASDQAMVLGSDAGFDWKLGRPHGHYYVAYSTSGSVDLSQKKQRKTFVESLSASLVTLQAQLGGITNDELDAFLDSFQPA